MGLEGQCKKGKELTDLDNSVVIAGSEVGQVEVEEVIRGINGNGKIQYKGTMKKEINQDYLNIKYLQVNQF